MKMCRMSYMHACVSAILSCLSYAGAAAQPLLVTQRTVPCDTSACGLPVSGIRIQRDGGLMTVNMTMLLDGFDMHGDRVAVFVPTLVNGADSVEFAPVGIYSHIRYMQYLRHGARPAGGDKEVSYLYPKRPAVHEFSQVFPYSEWMDGATLYMKRADYGCCSTRIQDAYGPLAVWKQLTYTPAFRYVNPKADTVKMRELSGRAYIDFPVNRTEIFPEYRKNPVELAKIIATIDSVRNDSDVTVKRITIKGYASPESPYDNNTRLAKGRTATLKQYVSKLYHFGDDFIATDYEPEDWEGLREFVAGSGLEHKDEILAVIDDPSLEPDPKELKIKTNWPSEYRLLLDTVYPGLRHSDYSIEYTIRQYNDPAEIRRIMAEAPGKLSLNEMFVLARSLEPGSQEYNDVFETAVRMFPNDETANLNAANAAMQRNDFPGAGRYLAKAGDSCEAVYARGIFEMLTGNTDKALVLFGSVAERMPEAEDALNTINEITKNKE